MFSNSHLIKNEIREKINELEQEYNVEISTVQKILLSTDGVITAVLDVLYGQVHLFVLRQRFEKADESTAKLLDIDEGDEVDYRELIVHRNGRPMVYTVSLIPKSRCTDVIIEDLFEEKLTTGQIIYKHEIEVLLKTIKISIEKPTPTLKEIFKTDEDMLTREYVMIHRGKIVIWTKELYPISFFRV
jgi:chorismate-pyruvate lyase